MMRCLFQGNLIPRLNAFGEELCKTTFKASSSPKLSNTIQLKESPDSSSPYGDIRMFCILDHEIKVNHHPLTGQQG